jgi:hypothetical protein
MRFFSFELETEVDRPEIGVGRKGVRDWGGANSSAAYLMQLPKPQGWRMVVHFLAAQ